MVGRSSRSTAHGTAPSNQSITIKYPGDVGRSGDSGLGGIVFSARLAPPAWRRRFTVDVDTARGEE